MMKKIFLILAVLVPMAGVGQRYVKHQRADIDTVLVKNPRSDPSTKVAVFDANGMIKYNYSAAGKSQLWQYDSDSNIVNNNPNGLVRLKTVDAVKAAPDWALGLGGDSNTIIKYPFPAISAGVPSGDTTGWDALCEGLLIWNPADSSFWQKQLVIDTTWGSPTYGDTTGCQWVQPIDSVVLPAWQHTAGGTILLYPTDKVGVGTSTPTYKFHVLGSIYAQDVSLGVRGYSPGGNGVNGITQTGIGVQAQAQTGYGVYIATNQGIPLFAECDKAVPLDSTMIFNDAGKLGIGTTTPDSTVTVTGSGRFTRGFKTGYDAVIYGVTVGRGNGKKSYGAPVYNTVLGNGAFAANIHGDDNVAIGRYSLADNTEGLGNNSIGSGSQLRNTEGNFNNSIGNNSLFSNLIGINNTAIGNQSFQVTTSSHNTGIGHRSGYLTTTGYSNTALGVSSLYSNTTGSNLVAVGDSSMYLSKTGLYNTAVGSKALYSNVTGYYNTAVGFEAGKNNTQSCNTFIGNYAGHDNTTGSYNVYISSKGGTTGMANVCVGHATGNHQTSGSYNTLLGQGAGEQTTTGFSNTSIGINSFNQNTTGHNNIVLGDSSGYNTYNQSYRMYLGARDSTTTGIFWNRTVGINKGYWNGSMSIKTVPNSTSDTILVDSSGNVKKRLGAIANWNTAYGWGNHAGLYAPLADSSKWLLNGSARWMDGKVGIGTSAPVTPLEVDGTSTLPTIIGGALAGSNITYTSTSGTGTTGGIAHQWKGGTNGATVIATMLNNGNVGIGRTTPTATLEVNSKSASAPQFRTYNSMLSETTPTDSLGLYVDPTGKVGIGTTAPTQALDVVGTVKSTTGFVNTTYTLSGTAGNGLFAGATTRGNIAVGTLTGGGAYPWMFASGSGTYSGGYFTWSADGSERMRLTTTGLGIGTTAPAEKLDVNGEIRLSDTLRVGNYTTYSYVIPGGNWVTSSTKEIKKNIADYPVNTDILDKITGINPKTWNFKESAFRHDIKLSDFPDSIPNRKQKYREAVVADSLQAAEKSKRKHKGFIAEDIATITGKQSKEVDQMELIMILWQANQALIRKVDDLGKRVAKLEKK